MVPFGGWSMPVQYRGIIAEHQAVRETVGLFDLSHMGRLYFRGAEGRALLQRVTTNNLESLSQGRAQYSLICDEQGGVLDDTVVYNLGDELLLVVNASNREKIRRWLERQSAPRSEALPDDRTQQTTMIGVQGPLAQDLLEPLTEADLSSLRYYAASPARVAGVSALVARTGYTGEDGFELIVTGEDGKRLWQSLAARQQPVEPSLCGLGARDTLRLEAGMPLYGHEISEQTNPFEAGLGRVVKLEQGDFVGRAALERLSQQPPSRRLVGFQMVENAVPRQGYAIMAAGRAVGEVTSGTFSPTLRKNLGMGYVETELAGPGSEIAVVVRGKPHRAEVVALPHYSHRTRRAATRR